MYANDGHKGTGGDTLPKLNYMPVSEEVVKLQQRQIIKQQKLIRELRAKVSCASSTTKTATTISSCEVNTGTGNFHNGDKKPDVSEDPPKSDIAERRHAQRCLVAKESAIRKREEIRNQVLVSETAIRRWKLEKLKKFQRLQALETRRERYLVLKGKAILFHQHKLKSKTLHFLFNYTRIAKEHMKKAIQMHKLKLLRKYFTQLKTASRVSTIMRSLQCVAFYQWLIIRRVWLAWRQVLDDARIKRQVSEDYRDYSILKQGFTKWKEITDTSHQTQREKNLMAYNHNNKKLLIKYFWCWTRLQNVTRLERQRQNKILGWKLKISDLIPDLKLS